MFTSNYSIPGNPTETPKNGEPNRLQQLWFPWLRHRQHGSNHWYSEGRELHCRTRHRRWLPWKWFSRVQVRRRRVLSHSWRHVPFKFCEQFNSWGPSALCWRYGCESGRWFHGDHNDDESVCGSIEDTDFWKEQERKNEGEALRIAILGSKYNKGMRMNVLALISVLWLFLVLLPSCIV